MNPQQPINPQSQQPSMPAPQAAPVAAAQQPMAQPQAVMPPQQPQIITPSQPQSVPAQPMVAQPFQPGVMPPQPQAQVGAAAQAQPPKANPNSTQNALQIAEIRDGIVIMNDGSFRSVVMLKSINFDLMSPQEQEAVEYSYQGFLNSLYFPIQIFIRSQKVDLAPYIQKLDRIRMEHDNMLLALLMEDYIGYIDQLSQQANIMDKKFYVVIPYFPHEDMKKAALDQSKNFFSGLGSLFSSKEVHVTINEADLEAAKTELRNRVQALLNGLLQSSIQGLPLDTQELIELYYDTYNPDTATRQELKNFNDLTADVVTKGRGTAPQQHLQRELQ
ncbi:MAG TPA: hypothetical protein VGE30_03730 [Candidatus Saccharimonadales bacterium]